MKKIDPPIIRFFLFGLLGVLAVIVAVFGFRGQNFTRPPYEIFPDMKRQPHVKSQSPSVFFPDGRGDRLPVTGTVPQEMAADQPYLSSGRIGDRWGTGIPVPVTAQLLERGRERFTINCKVCHGGTGAGNGIAKVYGMATVASLHQDRLRTMPDGEIFNTITYGRNTMGGYPHLKPEDRWAIVAYVRALQLSQHATPDDIPEVLRGNLPPAPAP
jgi:mono/diheme cytochrome c family protein